MERLSDLARVVAEHSASPRAKDQVVRAVVGGDGQYSFRAFMEDTRDPAPYARVTAEYFSRVRSRRGQERDGIRLGQQPAVVAAVHGNVRATR